MIQHRFFSFNAQGIDFFVGDLHGEYTQLMHLLQSLGFNFDSDRLFAVGDLIDRGPESQQCLSLIEEPWFYSTLGNHEAMLIGGRNSDQVRLLHRRSGGAWVEQLSTDELNAFIALIDREMPLSMTVDTTYGQMGLVHAAAPSDWESLVNGSLSKDEQENCIWSIDQYKRAQIKQSKAIEGIDRVVHGHVNCLYIEKGENQIWLDTLLQSGRLSIRTAQQLFEGP